MTLIKTFVSFFAIFLLGFINSGSHPNNPRNSQPKVVQQMKNHEEPLKVAVIGLTHDHVHWILGRKKSDDIEIVAIVEPNEELVARYQKQYNLSKDLVYRSMKDMMQKVKPEAVMAFNDIYGHLEVVEYFAPKGIHIMVEKPLAVSLEHAEKMITLAKKHKVHLMTNYETSWYGSNAKAFEIIREEDKIGDVAKIVFNTGHPGPKEIGCSKEFLEWLTDPVLNGGGSLTDFGCYGANIATLIMKGEPPVSVACVTQQTKPDLYPKVDDDATIILTYPKVQVLIQASWNWSHSRKDMAVYGKHGYLICENNEDMQLMVNEKEGPKSFKADPLPKGLHDPFAYFTKLVKEDYPVEPYGLSSMENNLVVVQILEAAKHASKTGQTVIWDDFFMLN
jgi:predicted dehydrogenase